MNAAEDNNTVRSRAEHVDVDTSSERISRLWTRVAGELEAKVDQRQGRAVFWQRPHVYVFASVMAVVLAGAGLLSQLPNGEVTATTSTGLQQATLETANDSIAVDLLDGSQVKLAAHTRVTVEEQTPHAIHLRLDHGRIECDVAHDPERGFFVRAAGVTVRVTGTRFSVEVKREGSDRGTTAQRVQVHVSRGSVEVQPRDGTAQSILTAGDIWDRPVVDNVAPVPAPQEVAPHVADEDESAPEAEVNEIARAASDKHAAPSETEPPAATPKSLLEQGRVARREGRPSAAAQAYQQLLQRFPLDSRAGLAAFELGRLRMDRLGDLPGAVKALRKAVRLAPGSGFREDAMARLVDAYDRLSQRKSCIAARDSYLKAFPSGVHAKAARTRCQ